MAHIVELIYAQDVRGSGGSENPVRTVMQLFAKDGMLVCEYDPNGEAYINRDAMFRIQGGAA